MVFRNVQALRAAAALLVVGVHVGNANGFEARYLSPTPVLTHVLGTAGWYGVDLFFVISGFIMTVTTWTLFGSAKNGLRFLLRRVTRIYPPYWIALLPILLLYLLHPAIVDSHAARPPDILASFLLFPQNGEPLLLVSWTLVFEMAFYLVFAVALCFPRRWLPAVLALWTLGIAFAAWHWSANPNAGLRFLGSPLPIEFFFGIGTGELVMRGILKRPAVAIVAGLVPVLTLMTLDTAGTGIDPTLWGRAVAAGFGFAAILYGAVVLEKARGVIFPLWLDALGDASYAMYLWHIPILTALGLVVVHLHATSVWAHVVLLVLAFGSVIATALLIFRFIERPLTRALQRGLPPFATRGPARGRRLPVSASVLE
jgi:exopolysaccharide production protein ExoZ